MTELVAYGLATPEIATRLFVEGSTVKHHLGKAMRKTETRNRVEIARWWWEHVEHPRSP